MPQIMPTSRMKTLMSDYSVVYSDQYFTFGNSLIGIIFPSKISNQNAFTLPTFQNKCTHNVAYMPIFNPLKLKCEDYPGILLSEEQNPARVERVENKAPWLELSPVIRCLVLKENTSRVGTVYVCDICNEKIRSLECEDLVYNNKSTSIAYKDVINMSRISIDGENKSCTMEIKNSKKTGVSRQSPVESDTKGDEGINSVLCLMSGSSKMRDFRFKKQQEYHQLKEQKCPRKFTSLFKSSVVRFSDSNNSSNEFQKFDDIHDFDETVPKLMNNEVCDSLRLEESELLENFIGNIPAVSQGGNTSESAITPASDASLNIQESSFSSIEPYPLPETPSLLLLEPLLLMQQDIQDGSRKSVPKTRKRRKEQLTRSEQQKVTRIMIGYTLAFFLLAIVTFYVVYFV